MLVFEYAPEAMQVAPQDEAAVRSTVTTVQADAPASVAPDAPDANELQIDAQTEGGLTTHQVASAVAPSAQYPPRPLEGTGDAIQTQVNDGIPTKGLAASLEASGRWGHGTMPIVEGIEPAIPASPFADRYFAALPHAVESTDYLTASTSDISDEALANAVGVNNAQAAQSPYSVLLDF